MTREPIVGPGPAVALAPADGRPLRVVHLLLEGEVDGIGLHVLDLAGAQRAQGTVLPRVVTCPSPAYARRLEAADVPVALLPRAGFVAALSRAAAGTLVPPCDVLHLHGRRACQLALAASLLPNRAISAHLLSGHALVATCHGWLSDTVRKRVRRRTELLSYRLLDLLIASSQEQADAVAALRGRRPAVAYVPNGVRPPATPDHSDALSRHGVPAGVQVVGNVGRLAPEKRQDVFLEACARIVAARPDTHVVLVGEGPARSHLERLARRLGISDRVHFLGFVEDVAAVYVGLSLLMHTSDTEGTPRAVVEAMALGVPVVATAVGGVPDLLDDGVCGVLTPPADPVALAREALRLLVDPAGSREMGERGRHRAAALSASAMARRVEDLYRTCRTVATPAAA